MGLYYSIGSINRRLRLGWKNGGSHSPLTMDHCLYIYVCRLSSSMNLKRLNWSVDDFCCQCYYDYHSYHHSGFKLCHILCRLTYQYIHTYIYSVQIKQLNEFMEGKITEWNTGGLLTRFEVWPNILHISHSLKCV